MSVKVDRGIVDAHFPETVKSPMITNSDSGFIRITWSSCWMVLHDRRCSTLNDVNRNIVRPTQGNDLRFTAPDCRVSHRLAICIKILRAHEPSVQGTCTVFSSHRRKEREEIVWMGVDIIGRYCPRCCIVRLGCRHEAQQCKLISNS